MNNFNDSNENGSLASLIGRAAPEPWAEGDNIPWNEEGFSERMLSEHLTQDHDMASRRSGTIDAQVRWIDEELLGRRPSRILDLGCGPGLYAQRLARLGHEVLGIDFSPASIRYARRRAEEAGLAGTAPRYALADLREADYEGPHDLAMQIFGELNVFKPEDAALILGKAARALAPGGRLLLEAHGFETIEGLGRSGPSWSASRGGLFSPEPHICLIERHWDERRAVATIRYDIVDAARATVARYAQSLQAWTEEEYRLLLAEAGFIDIEFRPGFGDAPASPGLFAMTASKGQSRP
jgi:SAM-dependent methyltransferase